MDDLVFDWEKDTPLVVEKLGKLQHFYAKKYFDNILFSKLNI